MQKIWLGVFLAMFLVPEILWSPVGNYIYSLVKPTVNGSIQIMRDNFLLHTDNVNLYSTVLFIQLVGSILYFIFYVKHSESIKYKWVFGTLGVFSFLFAVVCFFLFGFSISLRHIGF